MLHKTQGVVFRFTKYGETSIIVTIFTTLFGIQSYIVNGVRSKSLKSKIALYQPLTLLDLVVYYKENASIKRIKELKCLHPYQTVTSDIRKSSIAMFIAEILNKTVKEESHAQELCDFIITSMIILDTHEKTENFHLIFLLKLSRYLGFGAQFVNEVLGGRFTDEAIEKIIDQLIKADYTDVISMTIAQRREILELLVSFYADHVETIGELKSLAVLREIVS
ncbi:DNA repair protein RecO [Pseudochryseolinea flava]|uniref:DNA repair protein RecO n=1 Tax=Pseudochryseolinea flava TaxID=2059302 RepID=A0A364Y8V5_9BACT|nr:DNA repair protein RecO [Pseudochryseolinea flava]RAW02799.1 DNA repair protein RecO [Pseudochryseolinea flava]